jgi:hypothetical protein
MTLIARTAPTLSGGKTGYGNLTTMSVKTDEAIGAINFSLGKISLLKSSKKTERNGFKKHSKRMRK